MFVVFVVLHVAAHALLALEPEKPFFVYEPYPGAIAIPAVTAATKNLEARHVFVVKRDGKSHTTKLIETTEAQIRPNVEPVQRHWPQVRGGEGAREPR